MVYWEAIGTFVRGDVMKAEPGQTETSFVIVYLAILLDWSIYKKV